MSWFDQLSGAVTKATRDLSGKAQELADTAKLNSKISDAKSLMKRVYAQIGEEYYKAHKDDADNEFAEKFRMISEAEESIAAYRSELDRMKGTVRCTSCGASVSKDALFCPKCGAKVEKPAAPEETNEENAEEPVRFCSICGEKLAADAQFCVNCGAPVPDEPVSGNQEEAPENTESESGKIDAESVEKTDAETEEEPENGDSEKDAEPSEESKEEE